MIIGFADAETERFFRDGVCLGQWRAMSKVIARKLDLLDAAPTLEALRSTPLEGRELITIPHGGTTSTTPHM